MTVQLTSADEKSRSFPLGSYELLAALHALPDSVALTTNEAAVFLRLSAKTLERMRVDGSGPPYIQGGARGARGINQKCTYLKEGLLAWQRGNEVTDAMHAAIRRGQAFTTMKSILDDEPFYVLAGEIVSRVWDAPLDIVVGRLGKVEIEWISSLEAASRRWTDQESHSLIAEAVVTILSQSIGKIEAALEASRISAAICFAQNQ